MQNTQATDHELVTGYINGNEANFEALLYRHKQKVFGYIYNLCKNRDLTNDIFQETFVKVIHTLKSGKYNEEGKFLPWVMRIAHNLLVDHFRKRAKMPRVESKNEDYDIFSTLRISDKNIQDEIINVQILDSVKGLIEFLPEEQREVVLLRHYDDLSFKEIADKTNVSINTALGRMRYALINLRKLIEEHDIVLSH